MQDYGYLVLVNVPPSDWSFKVDGNRNLIGRSSTAQIRIPNSYARVSRRHAEIWWDKSRFWIRDLGSGGGTRVNGVWLPVKRPVTITLGDRLTLSDVDLDLVDAVPRLAQIMIEAGIEFGSEDDDCETLSANGPTASPSASGARHGLERLTAAELDIVLWMCRGFSDDADLGRQLFRSPNTVRTQVGSILQKLELHSRLSIVNWLQRAGSAARRQGLAETTTDTDVPVVGQIPKNAASVTSRRIG